MHNLSMFLKQHIIDNQKVLDLRAEVITHMYVKCSADNKDSRWFKSLDSHKFQFTYICKNVMNY